MFVARIPDHACACEGVPDEVVWLSRVRITICLALAQIKRELK